MDDVTQVLTESSMGSWLSYVLAMMMHSDSAVLYGDCGYMIKHFDYDACL